MRWGWCWAGAEAMSGEKTEEPTQKKLDDQRKKGNVAKSKDVASTASLIAVLCLVFATAPLSASVFIDLFGSSFEFARTGGLPSAVGHPFGLLAASGRALAWCSLPALAVGILVAVGANLMQIGFMASFEALKPKPDKFNPAANLKQMFSPDALFEFLLGVVKLALLGAICWLVAADSLDALIGSLYAGPSAVVPVLKVIVKNTLVYFCLTFTALAAADFAFRKYRFKKQNMMSKDEVKREYKDSEGDPMIKSRRRQIAEEAVEQAILDKTRKATVLVVNPTHYAVAITYDEKSDTLPIVVGKGEGRRAIRMIKAAEEAGVPILRDVPLARGLFAEAAVDYQIPVDFIKPVADVLRWVKRFNKA